MIIEKIREFVNENNYSECQRKMGQIAHFLCEHLDDGTLQFNKCGASQMPLPRYFSFHNVDFYLNHVPGCNSKSNIGASKGYYIVYLFNLDSTKVYLSLASAVQDKTENEISNDINIRRINLSARTFDFTNLLDNIDGKLQMYNHNIVSPNTKQKKQARNYELATIYAIEYDLSLDISDQTFKDDFIKFEQLYNWLIEDITGESAVPQIDFQKIKSFFDNYQGAVYSLGDNAIQSSGKAAYDEWRKLSNMISSSFSNEFESSLQSNWQNSGHCSRYFWNRYKLKDLKDYHTCIGLHATYNAPEFKIFTTVTFEHSGASESQFNDHNTRINRVNCFDGILRRVNNGFGYDEICFEVNEPFISDDTSRIIYEIKESIKKLVKSYKQMYELGGGSMLQKDIEKLIVDGDINQIIFTGAPGTGKTFIAKNIANKLGTELSWNNKLHYQFVQFHPSYDYTDFVEGLRPIKNATGVQFAKIDGIFKAFCRNVIKENNNDNKYFFLIDEINRADLSKVFGELMFCLEKDKRGTNNRIQTQYQNLPTFDIINNKELGKAEDVFYDGFYIPENVFIIGTMNDIDRSVESMDFALRRRFEWKNFEVTKELLKEAFEAKNSSGDKIYSDIIYDNAEDIANRTMEVNKLIYSDNNQFNNFGLNKEYYISQGQLANIKKVFTNEKDILEYVWYYRIKSLLREYLRGENEEEIETFLNECSNKLLN